MRRFPFIPQRDSMDCGVASLAMISKFYGKKYTIQYLRDECFLTREGVSFFGISKAAQKIGLETYSTKLSLSSICEKIHPFPCILHWNQDHFVVLYKITKSFFKNQCYFYIADPAYGLMKLNESSFKSGWVSDQNKGFTLFLKPTADFYTQKSPKKSDVGIKKILQHIFSYPKQISLMFLMLLLGSGFSLIFPFLTQSLIDKGVQANNINHVIIILLAQLSLFLGTMTVEIIRNWITLYMGTKLGISIISSFLKKLLQLPIKFFDTKNIGDINQRIQDNERVENFLTSQSLFTFFSMITFIVYFGILWYYDVLIVSIYVSLTIVSILWSIYWLEKRKHLDYFRFQHRSKNQESIFEFINGLPEMKLNQMENFKIKQWETIQQKLFNVNIRILKMNQIQLSGFEFINQVKNIIVTFFSALLVIKGTMTLGELLSVSYIIGQMNSPINQLIDFFRALQDTKLSLTRLNEIENNAPEDTDNLKSIENSTQKTGITLENITFKYQEDGSEAVLKNITFNIPKGKVTAIVGESGSGKTTLMKLLLKFYLPTEGKILYNNTEITELSATEVRKNCGVVMQDGYIFSDTIERNIATGEEEIDREKLLKAVQTANIKTFIENQPLSYLTKIGAFGNGISGGQKQRILIARAVYKNPQYIFFDEATSALDSENERIIHNNLQSFFKGKTVIVIAHRLSTVKKADQIIVLKKGKIIEKGTHNELILQKKEYFNLIKNQLELGN